jgi:hypothetical protein
MNRTLVVALRLALALVLVACGGANNTLGNQHGNGDDGGASQDGSMGGGVNLTASAMTQDFGSVLVGKQSQAIRIDVINIGTASSGVLSTGVTGMDNGEFVVDNDGCSGQTLAAQGQMGNKCTITMHFAPQTPGMPTATLTAFDGAGDSVSVSLTGTATAPVEITLLPAMQDFGTVVASSTSAPTTFTLANTGMTDAGKVQMSLSGMDAEQFTTSMDTCSGVDLKVGARCSIVVTFAPTTAGMKMATLTASLASAPTVTSALTGTCATNATFQVLQGTMPITTLDMGQAINGTMASANTIMLNLQNSGGVTSGVPTLALSGPNAADFALSMNGCTAALAAGASCQFDIGFGPTVVATETATLTITGPGTTTATLDIQGEGVKQAALKSSPGNHNFGTVQQGQTSSATTFTITNTGNVTTGVLSVSLTGTDPSEFQVGADTCDGATLAGGATCTIAVTFAPDTNASGGVRATLSIDATPGGPLPVTLTGTAATPASLSIGPGAHGFGSVAETTQTSPFTFTVSNNGTLASGSPTVSQAGPNKADFKIVSDTCTGTPIPGNGTCTVAVAFKPSTLAAESASITINASPGGSVTAKTTGTGASAASLQVTPNPGPFGPVVQGVQSPNQTFTVTNTGGVGSGMISASIGGTNAGDFKIATNNCSMMTLPANGAMVCTILVWFKPSTTMNESATLTVSANPGGMATTNLTGTGAPPGTLSTMPTSGAFANTNAGTPSPGVTFQVSNTGFSASGVPTVAVTGTNKGDFKVTASTCTKAIPAMTMNACQITVVFTPGGMGNESAQLNITANPGSTQLSLGGLGTEPSIGITPASRTYYVGPGQPAETLSFQVTNNGTGPTGTLAVQPLASPFSVTADGCSGKTWGAGSSCSFSVAYAPPGAEAMGMVDMAMVSVKDTTYTFVADNAGAMVTGTAEPPVTLSMTPMTPTYTGSSTVTFTVTNTGPMTSGTLATPTWSAHDTGANDLHADFAVQNNNCSGTTLNSGKNCSFDLVFTAPAPSSSDDGGAEGGGTTVTFSGSAGIADDSSNTASQTFSGSYTE